MLCEWASRQLEGETNSAMFSLFWLKSLEQCREEKKKKKISLYNILKVEDLHSLHLGEEGFLCFRIARLIVHPYGTVFRFTVGK